MEFLNLTPDSFSMEVNLIIRKKQKVIYII